MGDHLFVMSFVAVGKIVREVILDEQILSVSYALTLCYFVIYYD